MVFSSEANELLNILQQNFVKCQRLVLPFDVCYSIGIISTQIFYESHCSGGGAAAPRYLPAGQLSAGGSQGHAPFRGGLGSVTGP